MPDCAICGGHVEGLDVATVDVEYVDKEKYGPHPEEYVLHSWCADRVFGGWEKP
jgi:hypothetical protein